MMCIAVVRNFAFPTTALVAVGALVVLIGCSSINRVQPERPVSVGPWDVSRAETLEWSPDDKHFGQDWALEASGLAFTDEALVAPSEKYARLLFIDPGLQARVVELGVPRYSELEGVAWHDGTLLMCDEAHAAVYRVELSDAARQVPKLAAIELPLEGIEVDGGKIGVEGIEISADGRYVSLLLERSGDPSTGCVSRLWLLRFEENRLVVEGAPIEIALEDCNWRLTGLAWRNGELLGLKTQYPGERYHIVEINRLDGETSLVQDLTDYLRGVRADGWGNNVEGIAIDDGGDLWMIGDNAVTGAIDDRYPPPTDERTLLVRIPPFE
jgi:uncharacterized protein YjiK